MWRTRAAAAVVVLLMAYDAAAESQVKRLHLEEATIADVQTAYGSGAITGHAEPDYTKFLNANGVRGKRIGVLRAFFGHAPIHAEVNKVANAAVEALRSLGATLVELNTPDLDSAKISSDISVHLYELKPALNSYLAAAEAPVKSLDEIISSGRFHPTVADTLKKSQSLELDDHYRQRLQQRSQLQQRLLQLITADRLDAIVFPHQQRLVVPVGETQVERNGALASVTGFPSIVVPGGFSSPTPTAAIGVPIGMEFIGKPWSEGLLIEIAFGYEQATRHRRPPLTTPALE
jgi:Asp-tRNA(Asn)/Glu-tRNA(Gln) amidotransferase A subunit family amidase